jgi:hypothetical protein
MFFRKAGVACGVGASPAGAMARLLPTVTIGRRGAANSRADGML